MVRAVSSLRPSYWHDLILTLWIVYLSDQCIPVSTFTSRVNMRSSLRLDRQLYVPRTKTRHWVHVGSSTPRRLCGTHSRPACVILDSRFTHLERNWSLTFFSRLVLFLFSFLYFIILFAVRANMMFIGWRLQMSEWSWIEFCEFQQIKILTLIYRINYIQIQKMFPTFRFCSQVPGTHWYHEKPTGLCSSPGIANLLVKIICLRWCEWCGRAFEAYKQTNKFCGTSFKLRCRFIFSAR